MNDIDVTRPVTRDTRTAMSLAVTDQETHRRIVRAVRWLQLRKGTTQRELGEVLGWDPSAVSRALTVSTKPDARRRDWKAAEVYRLSVFFDVPIEIFYSNHVEEIWEARMAAARDEVRRRSPEAQAG